MIRQVRPETLSARRQGRNMRGMATWLKVLLIVFALGAVGIVALIGGIWYLASKATNPAELQKVAESMLSFDGPLPDKFKYTFGFSAGGTGVVAIMDQQDKALYTLFSVPPSSKSESTPDAVIDGIAKGSGAPTAPGAPGAPSAAQGKFTVIERGTMDVGGLKMPYANGMTESASSATPTSMGQFWGACQPAPGKGMVILMVTATTPGDEGKLSVDKVKTFTGHITAFK